MCTSSPPKPPPPPPPVPVQPPALNNAVADVEVGNQSEASTKRRKVGRSQLRSASASPSANKSGLGS